MKDLEQLYRKFGRTFPANTVLFEENQECNAAYIICKGKVRIYKKAAAKEIDIDLLGDGLPDGAAPVDQRRHRRGV
jgi:CRP-like cAMP-binding protein